MKTTINASHLALLIAFIAIAPALAATPPGATTLAPSQVLFSEATLKGLISPGAQPATVWFEYGTTAGYGSASGPVAFGAGNYPPSTRAVFFNGVNQNATVPSFGNYAPTNEITIEFWQNVTSARIQSTFILSPDMPTDRINAHVPWIDGNVYWDFGTINGTGRLAYPTNVLAGVWNHLALVTSQSGNFMRIYRNGVLEAQKTGMSPFTPYNADLLLAGGTNGYFAGSLAEFRVWNQALDQPTIQTWMNRTLTSAHPAWSKLVAYWPMNEGNGSTLNDQSGNGHAAALNDPGWQNILNSQLSATIAGLSPTTTYHYRVVATNSSGVTYGNDLTFTTPKIGYPFTTLYNFTNGFDGSNPFSELLLSSNTLYGTTLYGGSASNGTVFKVNTNGYGFLALHTFAAAPDATNSGGFNPIGKLAISGGTLYGVAASGGSAGNGTLFKVNTDGTGFSVLHDFSSSDNFTNSDGLLPEAGLVLSGSQLYGAASGGGSAGYGTLFKLNTNGSGFVVLHTFTNQSDGSTPYGRLVLSGNVLYGTAAGGGAASNGTVFKLNTDGTAFTTLHSFTAGGYANPDGSSPNAGLLLVGDTLYGTAVYGGLWGVGTVFKLNTNGGGFSTLHSFASVPGTNEGNYPHSELVLSANTLYGTTVSGGPAENGTVFKVNTDGTGFATMHAFTANYTNRDGEYPNASLVLSGNTLYSVAYGGGSSADGTLFALSLGPELTMTNLGGNLVLTWPTNFLGYTLQSTTNLGASAAWSTVSLAPFIVGGQYSVTTPISGPRKFFRLNQ